MYNLFINANTCIQFETLVKALIHAESLDNPSMVLVTKGDVIRVYNPFLKVVEYGDKLHKEFDLEQDALKYIGSFLN